MRAANKIVVTVSDIDFDVEYDAYSDPGKTSGPPENCYPPDAGMDFAVFIGDVDVTDVLAQSVLDKTEDACWDDFNEQEYEG